MGGGAKLTPRQKMINLMYLIFISMLAMNMSKEVLSAFGVINEKLTVANTATEQRIDGFIASLDVKAAESPDQFKELNQIAHQIDELSANYYNYLADLKKQMNPTDNTDYETMDKADFLDNAFFEGEGYKEDGEIFLKQINDYREKLVKTLKEVGGMDAIIKDVKEKFKTDPVPNREGIEVDWLYSHFKGFPLIASLTKITQLQSDIKTTESEILSRMVQGSLASIASMDNYTTLLETSKSAYFNGEKFDGQIVLGRKDASTKPNRVELKLDGRDLKKGEYSIEDGKVKLLISAGSVGEHEIKGNLIFLQDGEEVEVPVNSSFATISKPNSATISADKMNVVYRGVENPMTISFAGVPDNKVNASAPGLRKISGSKYMMNVTRVKGREVTINVNGRLPGDVPVSDKATFRIKDLPRPTGTVRGEDGAIKMQRNSLEMATIGAKFMDFDFSLPLDVKQFKFKVPGQPTIIVRGKKLDSRALGALRKAKRGADVTVFDIKAEAKGVTGITLKKVSPVIIELTN